MYDILRNFAPFVQFRKRKKHLRRNLHLVKSQTFVCKFYKWYQIAQSFSNKSKSPVLWEISQNVYFRKIIWIDNTIHQLITICFEEGGEEGGD